MPELLALALKFACLHKQVTEWVLCGHHPRHEDLADALVRGMSPCSIELEKAIRSATVGRNPMRPDSSRASDCLDTARERR